jgi:hypothetical protein
MINLYLQTRPQIKDANHRWTLDYDIFTAGSNGNSDIVPVADQINKTVTGTVHRPRYLPSPKIEMVPSFP